MKAWNPRPLSGGGLAMCTAFQSCLWQAKLPLAVLIPSLLIFLRVLWVLRQYPHSVDKETVLLKLSRTAKEACHRRWAGVPFPRAFSSKAMLPNNQPVVSAQVEWWVPDEKTQFGGPWHMKKVSKTGGWEKSLVVPWPMLLKKTKSLSSLWRG